MTYTEFVDLTGSNAGRAPFQPGGLRLYYGTGTGGVQATAAQVAAARAAGMTIGLYDQWPGLADFASGGAQLADVEQYAGTAGDAASGIIARRGRGITVHTVYCSYSRLAAVRGAIADLTGVWFGVADYSWSLARAQGLLAANPDWGFCQFGDPASNPLTLVPGTNVDLAYAQADINVGTDAWIAAVFGGAPAPVPAPAPGAAPAWPFGPGDYLSTPRADPHCHSGYYSSADNHVVAIWQQRMLDRGWRQLGTADGRFGPKSLTVCEAFQAEKHLAVDGKAGPLTWGAAWTAPVT